MSKPEWGAKRICESCGAKFCDLLRSPVACPRCGAAFDAEPARRGREPRPGAAKAVSLRPVKQPDPSDETEEEEDEDEDGEDVEELEDAEDDDAIEDVETGDEDVETGDEDLDDDSVDSDENGLLEDASELVKDDGMSKVVAGAGNDDESEV